MVLRGGRQLGSDRLGRRGRLVCRRERKLEGRVPDGGRVSDGAAVPPVEDGRRRPGPVLIGRRARRHGWRGRHGSRVAERTIIKLERRVLSRDPDLELGPATRLEACRLIVRFTPSVVRPIPRPSVFLGHFRPIVFRDGSHRLGSERGQEASKVHEHPVVAPPTSLLLELVRPCADRSRDRSPPWRRLRQLRWGGR